jgi:hypothetical protein
MVQMLALNTPQFERAECRLPHPPQPVPPIFQPEVAARAVVWAAVHRRRELYVGSSTVKAIWANKFVAGLLDRYLAHAAYSAQMQDRTMASERPSNLWNPVPGLHATHGPFSEGERIERRVVARRKPQMAAGWCCDRAHRDAAGRSPQVIW